MTITGILLAAGRSRRFGADKLLHSGIDNLPLAVRSLRNLRSGVDRVVAVTRPGATELRAQLTAEGACVAENKNADSGMGTSLARGVRATLDADGWVIALADMPGIHPTTIKRVADTLRRGAPIVAPIYRGERGHPVGFAARFRDELLKLEGNAGAQALLARHAAMIDRLACDDPGILFDVDTPADLVHDVFATTASRKDETG